VAIFTMDQRKEQRVFIKFCASLGKRATETLTMIQQALGDHSLSRAQVSQLHTRVKIGHTSVDDFTMTDTQEDQKAAQLVKLSHEFKNSSVRIEVEPFATLLRRWEYVMGHANGF